MLTLPCPFSLLRLLAHFSRSMDACHPPPGSTGRHRVGGSRRRDIFPCDRHVTHLHQRESVRALSLLALCAESRSRTLLTALTFRQDATCLPPQRATSRTTRVCLVPTAPWRTRTRNSGTATAAPAIVPPIGCIGLFAPSSVHPRFAPDSTAATDAFSAAQHARRGRWSMPRSGHSGLHHAPVLWGTADIVGTPHAGRGLCPAMLPVLWVLFIHNVLRRIAPFENSTRG